MNELTNIENNAIEPALYLVPTPIGNLDDITLRAVKVLRAVDIIASEDTRRTGMLLKLLKIQSKKTESYHDHNEEDKAKYLVKLISEGKSIALVSDAGSPAISDPGYRIVKEAALQGIKIIPLPGATAFVPALTASGLHVNAFTFLGFPPQKKGRKTFLSQIPDMKHTVIMYESPHRIEKLVDELIEICGEDRQVCVAREISKIYEEFVRGSLKECKDILNAKNSQKGEFVLVLQGKD